MERIAAIVCRRIQSMKSMVGDDVETLREIERLLADARDSAVRTRAAKTRKSTAANRPATGDRRAQEIHSRNDAGGHRVHALAGGRARA